MLRQTHTYVNLEISHAAFNEIKRLLLTANYTHLLQDEDRIQMEGIALVPPETAEDNSRSVLGRMERMHVYVAIDGERDYQDQKHGAHKHSIPEWLTIMGVYAAKAHEAFVAGDKDCHVKMLDAIRKLVASGVCCMEQNGVVHRDDPHAQPPGDLSLQPVAMLSDFRKDIENTINRYSKENGSNTPDYILAQFLVDSLSAYDKAVTAREKWYGREPVPCPPDQCPPPPDVVGKPFLTSI
jgi:hypothetical protein